MGCQCELFMIDTDEEIVCISLEYIQQAGADILTYAR
jgi:hypothetical protein